MGGRVLASVLVSRALSTSAAGRTQEAPTAARCRRWQFSYVESLTWVQLRPRNELLMQPSPYFRQSHVSLLMFRRTGTLHPACMTLFYVVLLGFALRYRAQL